MKFIDVYFSPRQVSNPASASPSPRKPELVVADWSLHSLPMFNGLMVTALALKAEGKVRRVGVLDCDQHYGDGTAGVIETLAIDWIRHVSEEHWKASEAMRFITRLPEVVHGFADCDLLLYQAGADPHVDDPLGGFMTTAELAERDRIVFSVAHEIGVPVVWNLAGGYQTPLERVLEIHRNTMAACVAEYVTCE